MRSELLVSYAAIDEARPISTVLRSCFAYAWRVLTCVSPSSHRCETTNVCSTCALVHVSEGFSFSFATGRAAQSIVKTSGVAGLWRGLGAQVARDVPFAVVMFVVYECVSSRPRFRGFWSGATAGAVASTVTAPLDLLKTRAMTSNLASKPPPLLRSLRTVVASEGPAALWKGSSHRILYKMGSSAVFFAALEAYRVLFARLGAAWDSRRSVNGPGATLDIQRPECAISSDAE